MGLRSLIYIVMLLTAAWAASVSDLDCTKVCTDPNRHDESDAVHCGCHDPRNHHHLVTATPVAAFQHTTLSMCDYLCSIQMGGSACDCSVSIVPGKRDNRLS